MQRYLREIRPTLALALPIIVGQVSQMLMGVLDSVMIGRVGTVPLAASSFGGNVFSVFYVVGIGLLVPVSIFAARSRGSGQLTEGADYLRHGLALALAFGVIETLVMVALSTQLDKFGQPPEVLALVKPFFLLIAASLVPVFVYLVLRQFAEAMGHPWMPLVIVLVSVGVNAVLNWVFIYGHLGAPALGLTGAGLSTLIARVLAAMAIFVWLRRDPAMRAAWPVRWFGNYSRERFRSMLSVGLPAGGMGKNAVVRKHGVYVFDGHDRLAWRGVTGRAPDCADVRKPDLHGSAGTFDGDRHGCEPRDWGRRTRPAPADRIQLDRSWDARDGRVWPDVFLRRRNDRELVCG